MEPTADQATTPPPPPSVEQVALIAFWVLTLTTVTLKLIDTYNIMWATHTVAWAWDQTRGLAATADRWAAFWGLMVFARRLKPWLLTSR